MKSLVKWFNRLNLSFLLFIIACVNYLGFRLYGGEEQYFAFAKQFMNPDWIPNSFTLTHPAGGNLLFEVIAGYALRYLSFEQLAFYGRLVNFAMLSIPMALIFRHFKLSTIESAFLFQLFFLPHQSLFAGEWIFQNFEVKTLAYIFVLYGVYYLLQEKVWLSAGFAAIGTWCHFLVGGWFFFIVMMYFIFHRESFKKLGIALILYGVIVLPFLFYLAQVYLIDNPGVIGGINTNRIYCYERLPFHLGIFKSSQYFVKHHLDGVLITLTMFLLCIVYFRKINHSLIKKLNTLNIIIFSQQFVFIGIALVDRNGDLLKTYPFRTSSLSALFSFIQIALILKYYLIPRLVRFISKRPFLYGVMTPGASRYLLASTANKILLVTFGIFFLIDGMETIQGKNTDTSQPSEAMVKIMGYIRENTAKNAVFLLLENDRPLSFHRIAERESFVVWKFTPTTSKAIYTWYDRYKWQTEVYTDISKLDDLINKYPIDYVISSNDIHTDLLCPIITVGNLGLYKSIR